MRAHTSPMIRLMLVCTFLAFALFGCAGFNVESDYDAAAEPALLETYAWSAEPSAPGPSVNAIEDEALKKRIHREVDANLAARGLRKVPLEDANVLVAQHTNVEVKTDEQDSYYAYYAVELYEEGTLAIEFTDAVTNRVVWQGSGRTRLRTVGAGMGVSLAPPEMFRNPKPRYWPAEEMVDSILAKYPAFGQ